MDEKLDRIDVRLLRLLQADGRMANADLARQTNISPATCHRRVERLFAEGYVRGVRARIAPAPVDRGTMVIVGVVLDRSTPESFATFEAAVRELPFILDCHLVAGDFDYFLKIRVRDISDFNGLHGSRLIG
ncbi:Lrp/AsnC family transcriptional regulator, partial [Methylobrevis pamukkalensis]|uniref:Lrp/AsnC family transcriptional regulator n=1 Tax=Methylobrevis pamukkalensis TaxID=1439726 RepID=UPI000845BC74